MKPKRKLRKWVRIALLMIPEAIIISELFFVAVILSNLLTEVKNQSQEIVSNYIYVSSDNRSFVCVEY